MSRDSLHLRILSSILNPRRLPPRLGLDEEELPPTTVLLTSLGAPTLPRGLEPPLRRLHLLL